MDFAPVLGLFGTPLVQAVRNQSKQFSVPSVDRSWLVGWPMFSDGFQPSLSPSTAIYDECQWKTVREWLSTTKPGMRDPYSAIWGWFMQAISGVTLGWVSYTCTLVGCIISVPILKCRNFGPFNSKHSLSTKNVVWGPCWLKLSLGSGIE